MATFEATRSQYRQEHFEVLEIDLPVITGTCTLGSSDGFGTPLTCDQAWSNEYRTYKFTNQDAPILPESVIYRSITSIRENTTELKPSEGLSARGSMSITLTDFVADPNVGAPAVTEIVKKQGTFFGKLSARQIMENKTVRLKLYRIEDDGTVDLVNGAETHHYIVESLKSNNNGTWSLQCKDVLSLANLDEKTWPPTAGGFLRQDIDEAVTAIPVDADTDYSGVFAVRIGDEFFKVNSVTGNLTGSASLTVATRGAPIIAPVSGAHLTRTEADTHSAGDEVFICDLSDNETIDSLLTRILVDSDFDPALIPAADWAAEVAEWHAFDKINTLHSEAEDVNDVISRILTAFLMDLWFDQIDNEAKLSAISVWKESAAVLTEGKEIDSYTMKITPAESLRASRALVVYDKKNLAENDDTSSFQKASQFADNQIISPALYKEHKDKLFENSVYIDKNAGDLLVQRYVSRFKFTPFNHKWETQERFLNFKMGDVVDLSSPAIQGASGLASTDMRAQITKIMPKYTPAGRVYDCTAMSYEAAFNDNSELVLDTPLGEVNFYTLAGAPSQAITITFVLKGSYSYGQVAMSAGNFPSGSKIILILADGFDGQANGGTGGKGASIKKQTGKPLIVTSPPQDGLNGGIVYDAQGVDTDIYFSGATPSAAYPTADGYIRAPSGGAGGFNQTFDGFLHISGAGGNGGDGRTEGLGGDGGDWEGAEADGGAVGINGKIDGTGTGWAAVGANNDASGGAAGSGIKDSGGIVTLFGADASRYINGNGDHP